MLVLGSSQNLKIVDKELKDMKKKFLLLTSLMVALLFIVACGGEVDTPPPTELEQLTSELDPDVPGWMQTDRTERVTLRWFVQADWWDTRWGDDIITRTIEEWLNIDVEFVTGDEETLNLLFASGDLPDIMTIFDANSQAVQGAATWALPLNELATTYDPYFFNVASPDTLGWFRLDDGNTYGYANYSNTFYDYENNTIPASDAFLIREDVYEAIGEMPMETPEEFLAALDAIADQFPDLMPLGGVGGADSGAGTFGTDFQNYIGVPIEDADGNFYNRNLDEDYLTWIRTFSEAHSRGHILDDSFVADANIFEEHVRMGNYATIFTGNSIHLSGNLQNFLAETGVQYIAIDGPASTVGRDRMLSQAGISGWMINHISKDANAEAAIQLFTFLLSDLGQMLTFYGIEGETFEWNDDGTVTLDPAIEEMRANDNDQFRTEYRFGEFMFFGHDRFNAFNPTQWVEAIRQPMEWGYGMLVPQFVIENTDPEPGSLEARSFEAINTEWNRIRIEMVRSSSDAEIDALLAQYEAFLENNNWDRIVEVKNANMDRNRERLGL
jgi:putative aldouronate transport system substrate-binding protein